MPSDILNSTLYDVVTHDTVFVNTVTASEGLMRTIALNGWDQPGSITAEMLDAIILEITPPNADEAARRLDALQRFGAGLRAYQAFLLWLDTPLPGLAAPQAPEKALQSLTDAQSARETADDPVITPRMAFWRMRRV